MPPKPSRPPHEKHGPPKPPHPPGPPHKHREKKNTFAISIIISTIVAAVFYYLVNLAGIGPEGSVSGSVALWVGLVTIIYKLLEKH